MRAFRFRLERILELRRQVLDTRRRELGHAEGERRSLAAQARHAEVESRRTVERLRIELAQGLPAGALTARQLASERTRERAGEAAERVAEAEVRVDQARGHVLIAQRAARILERLRERAWTTYRREDERLEQRELDEAGVLAWGRRRGRA